MTRTGLSAAGAGPDGPQIPVESEYTRRWSVFALVSVALLMSSIDMTIVATALPTIRDDLHASINWAAWTITVYSLGRVLTLPVAGRLSDQYGRRTVFLGSVALFTVSSLACGLAGDIYLLVVLRAVQAVGGAAFMPSATGIVVDHFGSGRDRAVGLFSSIIPVGAIIGPILGGVFVAYWSWRGIFLVNVPIGIAVLVAGRRIIPRDAPSRARRNPIDLYGMALLAAALLGAMLGVAYLGDDSAHPGDLGFVLPEVVAAVAVVLFLRHIGRVAEPVISRHLLAGRGFGAMNMINFIFGATALGFSALVPLYAVERYGIGTLDSGTLLTFRAVAMIAVAGLAALALRRTGYRWPMRIGFAITAVGLVTLAVDPVALGAYGWLSLAAGLSGIGMGVANPAAQNALLQLEPEQAAAISGLRGMFAQAGSIMAISVTTAIMARSTDPGVGLGHIFAVFAVILLASLPLVSRIPEHRGSW